MYTGESRRIFCMAPEASPSSSSSVIYNNKSIFFQKKLSYIDKGVLCSSIPATVLFAVPFLSQHTQSFSFFSELNSVAVQGKMPETFVPMWASYIHRIHSTLLWNRRPCAVWLKPYFFNTKCPSVIYEQ